MSGLRGQTSSLCFVSCDGLQPCKAHIEHCTRFRCPWSVLTKSSSKPRQKLYFVGDQDTNTTAVTTRKSQENAFKWTFARSRLGAINTQHIAVDDCTRCRVLALYSRQNANPHPAGTDRSWQRILCNQRPTAFETIWHQVPTQQTQSILSQRQS